MALRSKWQDEFLIEIMVMIVKKVSIGDYVRMAVVCKSWRSMLTHEHVMPIDVEAPWLLLLKDCAYNHHTGFNFYSLSDSRFYTFKLPTHILKKYPKVAHHDTTFCYATSNGWLLLVTGPTYNPDMFLFDPISEIDVKLPLLTTLPYRRIAKVKMVHVLSISDNSTKNQLIVVATFSGVENGDEEYYGDILAFCNCNIGTEEERSWKTFVADRPMTCYESMLFHDGVLYTIVSYWDDEDFQNDVDFDKRIGEEINHVIVLKTGCCEVKMKIIDIVKHNTAPHIRTFFDNELQDIAYSGLKYVHLVKSITGELLIIWNKTDPLSEHDNDYLDIYHTSKLVIERYEGTYKTDKDFESITSLDDQALFVSPNSNSFSIPTRSGNGCQANCIYFTVDAVDVDLFKKSLTLKRQSGIYCMQEERIRRPFPSPPLWFQPRLRN